MPLGISYFVFRMLQYVFDCMRDVIKENTLLRLAAFMMWIPAFPAGPLETYQGFYEKRTIGLRPPGVLLRPAPHRPRLLQEGLRRRLPVLDLLRQDRHDDRQDRLQPARRQLSGGRSPTASSCSCAPTSTSPRTPTSPSASRACSGSGSWRTSTSRSGRRTSATSGSSWHISLSTWVPQQRLLPGVRPHAQDVAGPVREHAGHGPVARRRPQLDDVGPLSRHRPRDRGALGAVEEGPQEGAQEGGPARRRPGTRSSPSGSATRRRSSTWPWATRSSPRATSSRRSRSSTTSCACRWRGSTASCCEPGAALATLYCETTLDGPVRRRL